MPAVKKAAFVTIVGRPSAGKSTLLNRFCGEKVAIVSPVPQTTRNAVRGIVNREQGQLVFVDTPGRHVSEKKFNKKLMEVGERSIEEADIVLYTLDASRMPAEEEEAVVSLVAPLREKVVFALNKIDAPRADPQALLNFLNEKIGPVEGGRVFKISALKNEGVESLLDCLFSLAPEGDAFYPEEFYTDQEVSFRIAEIIREKAIRHLRQEIPHSIYVDVADAELKTLPEGGQKLWVRAFIVTERESQKGMVVGKGGAMIKQIRLEALKDLKRIFDWKLELDLRVKTAHDWRHNDATLRRLIRSEV
ncbi:MAG: GTPase Era [Treponema sp.]|jgi:GTP-binding protein Era|nr:GTPase Era [Treponema sp.]